MAALTCRVRAFTTSRPQAARPQVGARPAVRRPVSIVRAVAESAVDVESYVDELDVPMAESTPLAAAGEKVRLRIRMRSYEKQLLEDCVAQIQAVAEATGAVFKGPGENASCGPAGVWARQNVMLPNYRLGTAIGGQGGHFMAASQGLAIFPRSLALCRIRQACRGA